MRLGSFNQMPMWAKFFAILLGIPLVAALLRIGFERKFGRLTALVLSALALLILWLIFRRIIASHPGSLPMSRQDKQREFNKFQGVVFAVFAAVILVGAGIGIYGFLSPASGPVWSRIACGIIGLIGLLLGFIFTVGSVQGFVRLTQHRRERPPRHSSDD